MKWKALLVALTAVSTMFLTAGAPSRADDGAPYVVTCSPSPSPEPAAEDDCLPDNTGGAVVGWPRDLSTLWPGAPDCEIGGADPSKSDHGTVNGYADIQCSGGAVFNLQITVKVFWTTCNRRDGSKCDLNTDARPDNPAEDSCAYCSWVAARAEMNARLHYCRYYWEHAVGRGKGFVTASVWSDPIRLCF